MRAVSSFSLSFVSVNFQPSVWPSFFLVFFPRAVLVLHIKFYVVPLYSRDVYSLPVMLTVSFGAVSRAADKLHP